MSGDYEVEIVRTLTGIVYRIDEGLEFEASPDPTRGMLCSNSEGIATCLKCFWKGVPSYVDEARPRLPAFVMQDGKLVGPVARPGSGQLSHECPVCDIGAENDADFARYRLPPARSGPKVSRNAPCPCGSGRKAKKCCHA